MKTSDWINLAIAISTFLAVAVALGLGVHAHRRARAEAMARGKLFAAGISASLSRTVDLLRLQLAPLDFLDLDVVRDVAVVAALGDLRRFLSALEFQPDYAELLALTVLPRHSANRIARATGLIAQVRKEDSLIPGTILESTTTAERKQLLKHWTDSLDSAHKLLKVALEECIKAAELGAPMPNGEELHGNQSP